ncbi:hypothetical protein ABZT06_09030 [Streptomyces sp. NPDC005483]|uniref:hypothetical protein n=1 Tax=Streptomyces sp. NPDC005483 TaxID=3154882 RepID=UPI0033B04B98
MTHDVVGVRRLRPLRYHCGAVWPHDTAIAVTAATDCCTSPPVSPAGGRRLRPRISATWLWRHELATAFHRLAARPRPAD